jgi:hypothetical protein
LRPARERGAAAALVLSAFFAQFLAPLRPTAAFVSSRRDVGAEIKNKPRPPGKAPKPGKPRTPRKRGKTGGPARDDRMTPPRITRVLFAAAALLLFGPAGCMSFLHPIDQPDHDQLAGCQQVPKPCRQHVYVFFVHGVDPLDFANLSGVRDYVQSLGFGKTYYGQMYHTGYFTDEIRKIHASDPEARFALVGFSFGANMVRNIANSVRDEGITIDLIVYCGGNTLENNEHDRPPNVLRVENILATGWVWNGATMDDAENINYDNVWHFGSPTHPHTLEVLGRELTDVAARVPYVERVPASVAAGRTSRPAVPQTSAKGGPRDEWDFLLPGAPVPEPPPKPQPPAPKPPALTSY